MLGGGARYTTGFEAADQRAFLGFIFEPSIGDRDGDGIKDDVDKCPDDPEDFDGFKDEDGCPDPDNDNDGIPDVDDRCPNVPEDRDGDQDEDGCPEGGDGDRDGDGILDSKDKCPDEPEDKRRLPGPGRLPRSGQRQGRHPRQAWTSARTIRKTRTASRTQDGCPDPDNDHDGIPDVKDKCPNEPETFNGFEDEDGCPDKGSVIIQDNNIVILDKIKFADRSARDPARSRTRSSTRSRRRSRTTPSSRSSRSPVTPTSARATSTTCTLTQDRVNSVMRGAHRPRASTKTRLRSKGYGEYCPRRPGAQRGGLGDRTAASSSRSSRRRTVRPASSSAAPTRRAHGVSPDPVP